MASGGFRRTHDQFNSSDADITIQSSDNILFRLHRQNLAVTTGAFPGSEFISTPDEVVHLTEPAKVLEIVFQFVYPRRDMLTLEDLDFETILAVAEAMEKYEVFLGIKTCTALLSEFLPRHTTEVIAHALKHDLVQLIKEAALLLARSPLLETLRKLPPHCIFPWVAYYTVWNNVFEAVIQDIQGRDFSDICVNGRICSPCRSCLVAWVVELERIDSLPLLKAAVRSPVLLQPQDPEHHSWCGHCHGNNCRHLPALVRALEHGIQNVPPFTHFLRPGGSN